MDQNTRANVDEDERECILEEEVLPWKSILHLIQPFDLILFRGSDTVSDIIALAQTETLGVGEFTHVGMAVTSDLLPGVPSLAKGKVYVAESTCSLAFGGIMGDQPPDVVTGKGKWGVQIRDLDEVIPSYLATDPTQTAIAWCPLIHNPWSCEGEKNLDKARKALSDKAMAVAADLAGRPYNWSFLDLLATIMPCLRRVRDVVDKIESAEHFLLSNLGIEDDTFDPSTWVFCSQLVSKIYQEFGIMPDTVDANDVTPADFLGPSKGGRVPLLISRIVRVTVNESEKGEDVGVTKRV